MKTSWAVQVSCKVLQVSVSGYFRWLGQSKFQGCASTRVSDTLIVTHMRAIHKEVKGENGWPRMQKELQARGIRAGKERVRKLMQQYSIRAKTKRKFMLTTDSQHKLPVAADLVQRRFTASAPNRVWTTDITYIPTAEGWLYLAVMLDLHSRQIVGWSLAAHMETSLVKNALEMAWWRRRPAPGLIVHSDRGSQYCSHEFQQTLKDKKAQSSMSRKGNCWNNAPTESLWARLKAGSVHGQKLTTREQAKNAIMDWIAFYNHRRLHSSLGYLSPMEYERHWHAAQRKEAA